MIDAGTVEAYLYERIPLSRHMGVQVTCCDDTGVRLTAPLQPNINHQGTVFGGSASAVAMICGWSLVYARIADLPFDTQLVIRRSHMQFDQPIEEDFEAWCAMPSADVLRSFDTSLAEAGKARLQLPVVVGPEAVTFIGTYVAVKI
jgi:thioesterase domain-containing protein